MKKLWKCVCLCSCVGQHVQTYITAFTQGDPAGCSRYVCPTTSALILRLVTWTQHGLLLGAWRAERESRSDIYVFGLRSVIEQKIHGNSRFKINNKTPLNNNNDKKNGCWNVTWNFVNVSVLNAVTILTLWKQIRKWVDETSKCITHSNSSHLFPLTDVKNLSLFINPVYKQEKWASWAEEKLTTWGPSWGISTYLFGVRGTMCYNVATEQYCRHNYARFLNSKCL